MLIVPGFVASGAMTFVMGLRRRDWGSSLIWSLVFSIFIYALLFLLLLSITPKLSFLMPFSNSLSIISRAGTETNVELLDAVRVAAIALVVAIPLGLILGWLQKTRHIKDMVARVTGHSYHIDVWGDFIEQLQLPAFLEVFLKDGNAIVGKFLSASDMHTGADKGLILSDPQFFYKAVENQFEGKEAQKNKMPGPVIIYFEQIAYVVEIRRENTSKRQQKGVPRHKQAARLR